MSKKQMQEEVERTEKQESKEGEQLDLIDISPENAKPIIRAARLYKKYQSDRLTAGRLETAQKERCLELVKQANLTPLAGGIIRFKCEGFKISVTPREHLIQIAEEDE